MTDTLGAVDAMIGSASSRLLLQRLTQADVTAFVAERLARQLGIDTGARMPRLRELAKRLSEEHPFRSTEP
jgi:glutathione S-transferase